MLTLIERAGDGPDRNMAADDESISLKLRAKLDSNISPAQILLEFKRYRHLIERPEVALDLRPDRERLQMILSEMLTEYQAAIAKKTDARDKDYDASEKVRQLYSANQIKYKVEDIESVTTSVLNDLPEYKSLAASVKATFDLVRKFQAEVFQSWIKDVEHDMTIENMSIRIEDNVISFNPKTGLMEVNYNSKLLVLIEDACQLEAIGFRLPLNISELVHKAKMYSQQSRELEQIANFHNTIGQRMNESQRPMMLETASELSRLVQQQNNIRWTNGVEIEKYISKLLAIVRDLGRQNSFLSGLHLKVKEKIIQLFNIDIITNVQGWKKIVREIQDIMQQCEDEGFKNTGAWRMHWDMQLYKAFEVQYTKALDNVNSRLPQTPIELLYRDHRLQFKPQLEDVRTKYYSTLKRFLSTPERFTGFQVDPKQNIFANIVKTNAHRFPEIYKRSEQMFKKIERLTDKFEEWTTIGGHYIENVMKKCLATAPDWDRHFRLAKTYGQDVVASVSFSDEVIGCFKISFATLRTDIETLNRTIWDKLVYALQDSILENMAYLEGFLVNGMTKLQGHPQTVAEITKAKLAKEKLSTEYEYAVKLNADMEEKIKLLVLWAKERIDPSKVQTLWETFSSLFRNHDFVIGRQVDSIRTLIQSQVKQFEAEVENFKLRWEELKKTINSPEKRSSTDVVMSLLTTRREEWLQSKQRKDALLKSCTELDVALPEFPTVDEIDKDLEAASNLWSKLKEFDAGLKELQDEDWIIYRSKPHRFDEYLQEWEDKFLADSDRSFLTVSMLKEIENYKSLVPHLRLLRGDTFGEKHWYELEQLLGISSKPVSLLKFRDFLDARDKISEKYKEIKELNARATGEVTVRQALNELDVWEIEARFTLLENTDSQGQKVFIIDDFKSILNKVGDNQSLLQSIKSSPFYANFADRITLWETRLMDLDECLVNLNKIQRRWVYLEPIFNHGVLDNEQRRFGLIDEEYRAVMQSIGQDNHVLTLIKVPNVKTRLSSLVDQLARCQKSLNEFLEKKRSSFPRFYFIGDDDLLEIMGQSTKPSVIQSHLKKLFAGIYNVDFDNSYKQIIAMKSLEGEVVSLKTPVKTSNNVEEWLSELSNEMKYTLKALLLDCISASKNNQRDPDSYPAQVLLLCNAIVFTDQCEEAIRTGKLKELLAETKAQLSTYTNVAIPETHPSPFVLELKLKDLVLDIIHEIYVIEYLLGEKVKNVNEWSWQKQLRFYVRDDGCATVKMADAEFLYSYEYQGNAQKLVHTPLTDKCYLTLTQGMRSGLGGNPYGPAGTGKTESVKALGGLLGRQVLVFNCDEGIDVKAMGRIFIGLVKCGAWGCFDEFNRLDGATLSAISMQIEPIQTALKNGHKTVRLMDEVVPLDSSAGIFVTLNPAGKGYGGRNKLPDNLKQLFRPVVMSSPNNDLIAEVILHTEGFKEAPKLGLKLVEVFTLSSKLLSVQKHYDWGLRALKTVLKGCGSALKDFKKEQSSVSTKDETDLVVASLRLNTLPKLTYADSIRFDQLVKDVFSNATFKDLGYDALANSLKEASTEMYGQVNSNQVRKCLELYEQLQQRMGVVIVGPPCCGKSTIWKLLRNALIKTRQNIKMHIINPKSMKRSQLLGQINLDTRQWTDGVLTLKAQEVYAETQDTTSWIICDGDIDPEWIESLNSVLDDNRLLTLPSGWRIKFGPNVNFIFETHDLSYASPATISRMGMILMSDEDADIKAVVAHWVVNNVKPENQKLIMQNIEDYFYKGLRWVSQQADSGLPLPIISVVKNTLAQLRGVSTVQEFTVAMIRGTSSHLSREARLEFAKTVLGWTNQPAAFERESHLNIFFNKKAQQLQTYGNEDLSPGTKFNIHHPPLVYTSNVRQIFAQIKPFFDSLEPFILVGPEGIGKTLILETAFKNVRGAEVATIYCSSLISPQHLMQKLSQVCITTSTTTGRVYKRKNGGHLILYFKDLNLVKPDKWGTCTLVELLLQIITYRGFYDSNLEWVELKEVQIVVSATLGTTKGRYNLSPRFLSNLRLCVMDELNKEQLGTIYQNYYSACLRSSYPGHPFSSSEVEIRRLTQAAITFYELIGSTFPEVQQSHYHLTPRHLTKLVCGMMRYNLAPGSNSTEDIITIWAYEASRLFRDKLVSAADKAKFDDMLNSTISNEWNMPSVSSALQKTYFVSGYALGVSRETEASQLKATSRLTKVAQEDFYRIVERGMTGYAREVRDLQIVLFPEVLENVAHFDHVLAASGSNLVLAGLSGIGRGTAIHIVSMLHDSTVLTLKIGRNYTMKQFKMDLKDIIQTSAIEGRKVFFVVEDFQLIQNEFLDMINGLLSTAEVPGLYTTEELEAVLSQLREEASAEGNSMSLHEFFAKRIRQFLHVILIMDYTNPDFKSRCESNPAIYKQCALIWLDTWSPQTLTDVPKLILNKFYKLLGEGAGSAREAESVIAETNTLQFKIIYDTLDVRLRSPKRYVGFIHTYANIFNTRRNEISEKINKLKAGIAKLQDASKVVQQLKQEAATQEVQLAEKQKSANNALEQITVTMRNANVQRLEMEDLQDKTMKENEVLLEKKRHIDEELKEIEPLIEQARSSVGNIKNEALAEIRSLRAPPDVIRDILEAVLRLMGVMDTSWNSMKTFLAQRGVKEDIKKFDAEQIKPEHRAAVQKLINERSDSFEQKNAKRASAAAAPLADWVLANVKYSLVLEKIQPLTNQQRQLEKNLDTAKSQLGNLSLELQSVDERVEQLKMTLNKYTKEGAEIEVRLAGAKKTLVSAETLVGKLLDEFKRWTRDMKELSAELEVLPSKCLLAAAFIAYLSDATEDVRSSYMTKWMNLCNFSQFDFLRFMSTEKEKLHFQQYGLPAEQLSHENAVITLSTCLRPFLIDPYGRATEWLKNYLAKSSSSVVAISLRDPKFSTELELAIRFGKSLIICEADEIEPLMVPILRGDLVSQGSRELIQVADKMLDFNTDFRVFFSTRNSKPSLSPDCSSLVTIVNFTTTRAGLVTQLLTTTLSHEKPELEERKSKLLKQFETLKIDLEQVSETLLQDLANAQGNILENQELLNSLNKTKAKSVDIVNALKESEGLTSSLNNEISVYTPLAEFGSKLFFAIIDADKLDPLYKFSLSCFINLFTKNLELRSDGSTESRMIILQKQLENSTFDYVCRSLFKADRLAFALHFAHVMHPECFQENEWEAFTGQLLADSSSAKGRKEQMPSWVNEDRALAIQLLKSTFPSLYSKLDLSNEELWTEFSRSSECENQIPKSVKAGVTPFQAVMLIQSLRPDRLHTQMSLFACNALGRKSLFPPPTNLRDLLPMTRPTEPILILVSSGADPSQELKELAEVSVGKDNYLEVSMGQGQFEIAMPKLSDAATKGTWLCLKNLHLVTYCLGTLEKEIQQLSPAKTFRLWLTAEPYEEFPSVLAESCLKIAYEAPQGMKKNMQRTYSNWPKEFVIGDRNVLRMQAMFALAFFHAVVQERRTYIAQGWSKFYEFNESDIRAGADVLDRMFKSTRTKEIQWVYVQGLFENTIYGGRIDNEFDNRVLVTYLNTYFSDSLLTGPKGLGKQICEGVQMPASTNYQDYINVIEGLLDYDKPAYFGLPSNIERSWQRTTSTSVINQLKYLSRTFSADVSFDRNVWSMELTPILNMWKRVNQSNNTTNLLQLKVQPPNIGPGSDSLDPINAFVKMEYYNAITFVKDVHKCLGGISKVIRGTSVPTSETISVANALLARETPNEWQQVWEGPPDPVIYLQGILKRVVAIQNWVPVAEAGRLLESPIKLSDCLHPDGFMCAFKQQCARSQKIPLDELVFACSWGLSSGGTGKLTCKLTGLLLEGCSFNGGKLIENTSESSPIVKIPDCTISWVQKNEIDKRNAEMVSIPFYSNEKREALLGSLDFPSNGESVKWIQAGVGIFLQN